MGEGMRIGVPVPSDFQRQFSVQDVEAKGTRTSVYLEEGESTCGHALLEGHGDSRRNFLHSLLGAAGFVALGGLDVECASANAGGGQKKPKLRGRGGKGYKEVCHLPHSPPLHMYTSTRTFLRTRAHRFEIKELDGP